MVYITQSSSAFQGSKGVFDTAVGQSKVAATVRRVPRGLVVAVSRASALALRATARGALHAAVRALLRGLRSASLLRVRRHAQRSACVSYNFCLPEWLESHPSITERKRALFSLQIRTTSCEMGADARLREI